MSTVERLLARTAIDPVTGCWLWTGRLDKDGYGIISINRKNKKVHRVGYEETRGQIPDGHTIDHGCHNRDHECCAGKGCMHRRCWNPSHIETATSGDNTLRGKGLAAQNMRKTHCKRGHEFTAENTYLSGGRRYCRPCHKIRTRESLGKLARGERQYIPSNGDSCKRGHEYTPENTLTVSNGRRCKQCNRDQCKKYYESRNHG